MRIKHFFGLAVLAAMTASCSSNNELVNGGNGSGEVENGTAYASFKINLPTTTGGTRADEPTPGTPSFEQGTAAEYEVKNGTILIFDKDGKFVESADLGTMNPWTDVQENGVTTAAIATVKLTKVSVSGTDKYKALVLLNNNTADDVTKKVTLPTASTDTYAEWSKDISKVNAVNYAKTDGIFMANAPMYNGTTTEPTTLVDIKGVYASPEEAQAKPATTIYVERGLACSGSFGGLGSAPHRIFLRERRRCSDGVATNRSAGFRVPELRADVGVPCGTPLISHDRPGRAAGSVFLRAHRVDGRRHALYAAVLDRLCGVCSRVRLCHLRLLAPRVVSRADARGGAGRGAV